MSGASLALESSRNINSRHSSRAAGSGNRLPLASRPGRPPPTRFEYAELHLAAPGIPGLRRPHGREVFAAGLLDLLTLAWGLRTAVMCAEILWWRCHRRMIA